MRETHDTIEFAGMEMARLLEADIHQFGWDMPPTLFDLKPYDVSPEMEQAMRHMPATRTAQFRVKDDMGDAVPGEFGMVAFGVHHNRDFAEEGHPFFGMIGMRAEPDVVGAILVTEGWSYPDAVHEALARGEPQPPMPPSEHPDRVEIRISNVAWKDGTAAVLIRRRDTDEVLDQVGVGGGRVFDALRLYLGGQSTGTPDRSARDYARWTYGGILARTILEGHSLLDDEVADLPDPAMARFAIGIQMEPALLLSIMGPVGVGLGSLLEPPTADKLEPIGPRHPAGSDEDLEDWAAVRTMALEHIDRLAGNLDAWMESQGKRSVGGMPAFKAKEAFQARRHELAWHDARLLGCDFVPRTCPDDSDLVPLLDRVAAEVPERGPAVAFAIASWAGLIAEGTD